MIVVPRKNTPLTMEQIKAAVANTFDGSLSQNELANLSALVAIETGRGKFVQNHSPGNVTASPAYSGMAWRPTWFELTPMSSDRDISLHELMLKNQAPSAFRAYNSFQEGFADWRRVLEKSFPEVLEAAKGSSGAPFALALAKKYSGDYKNPASHRTLELLADEFGGTSALGGGGSGLVWIGAGALAAAGVGWLLFSGGPAERGKA